MTEDPHERVSQGRDARPVIPDMSHGPSTARTDPALRRSRLVAIAATVVGVVVLAFTLLLERDEPSFDDSPVDYLRVLTPPPPPGTVPFQVGERLTYAVIWEGGPLDLPAATATLRVSHPTDRPEADIPGPRWAFEATAATADWVSSVFEARYRFTSVADETLRPLEHTQEIRQGRKRVDHISLFDTGARVFRMGPTRHAAAAAPGRPMPSDARDPLTTLFYVRTLSLRADSELTLLVNDAGRNMTLVLRVAGLDMLRRQGGEQSAWRLEPRVLRSAPSRQPLSATVWISADARRVPLAMEVARSFWRVRAELVDSDQ